MTVKIMHVEDDEDTRTAVELILKKHGFEVTGASSGKECFQLLKKEKPSLILLDMMIPDMSGWDVFQKLKKMRKLHDTKMVFLSVLPILPEKKRQMYNAGVASYIMKPFTEADLVSKVKKLTEAERLGAEEFIRRITGKKKSGAIADIIINSVVLQTIEELDGATAHDIMKAVIMKLKGLLASPAFLPQRGRLRSTVLKLIDSKYSAFVGSRSLYSLLSRFEKYKFVDIKTVGGSRFYELTERGKELFETLPSLLNQLSAEQAGNA